MYHCLTDSKDQLRDLAWMCTPYQSCSQFIKEQKSQYDQLVKMARTCSNKAHKSYFHAEFTLRKLAKALFVSASPSHAWIII